MFKKHASKIGCLFFLIIVVWSFWVSFRFKEIKENMASKDSTSLGFFLPDQATNISYYRNFRYLYYECDVSEKDVLDFTSKKKWTLQPISEEPIEMECLFFSTTNGPQRSVAMDYFEKHGERKVYPYFINEGYYYDDMTNRGGYRIVYDTSLGKLFFELSMR